MRSMTSPNTFQHKYLVHIQPRHYHSLSVIPVSSRIVEYLLESSPSNVKLERTLQAHSLARNLFPKKQLQPIARHRHVRKPLGHRHLPYKRLCLPHHQRKRILGSTCNCTRVGCCAAVVDTVVVR